ncbi:GDSL-type esterase/lipase family protein [Kitasatospora sp. CM 4170]|uniref:GDSL-type esterase/lipase family protein n=1 Tax=Kitasatospora aburaviensis TaxID=67265 RepID=A0ABW1FA79_9ACTN|nr:GDSL-type esterase/lipase family protein [Kitasatospora sp. CM 4170]WNM49107.1 GDSL-type esterase/lipase family protein [Kitasatospora sp. CM 4170]
MHARRRTSRLLAPLTVAALALPLALAATPARAADSPTAGSPTAVSRTAAGPTAASPTAAVAMGDSYISGEAGRWKGNSLSTSTSRAGTDRAWTGSSYDPSRVYGASAGNGCDRSDVAEIRSAPTTAQYQINLACSGATSANIPRAAGGGQSYKGEAPQADQLAQVARNYNVKLVSLSIGGNDLGFADVIISCVQDYEIWNSYCHDDQQEAVDSRMDEAMAGVAKSIDEIRAVMTQAGQAPDSYRIVLQSYPSPIPRSSENRYPESGWSRTSTGGCPFWNQDADWARDRLVPQISDRLARVAAAKGVQFLDLRDMLQGREVCSTATRLATPSSPPTATGSEWARFLDFGTTVQGTIEESFHPNYYGQQALGRCLTLLDAKGGGNWSCRNTAGRDSTGMYLTAR